MITLYSFGPKLGLADPSPFVLKINLFLKMAGIEYQRKSNFANLQKAPKGKLPYIKDGETIIADSNFIIAHIKEKYGVCLDQHLTEEDKALSYLIAKSLDENFYWCLIYSRWIDEKTWPKVKKEFFGRMSFPLNKIVPYVARKNVRKSFMGHGMGKHSEQEILEICRKTLESLSTYLGEKPYFFGEKQSSLDAVAYAFLSQFILASLETPMSRLAKKYDNLVEFCQRIQNQYYPE